MTRPSRSRLVPAAASAALVLSLSACSWGRADGPAGRPEARPAQTSAEIAIDDGFQYKPQTLTVAAGTPIDIVNRATTAHTVTADAGAPVAFDTGLVPEGDRAQIRLTQPGRYPYHDARHPTLMHGVVVVR